MRVHYLQHVPFEGLGSIAGWLKNNECEVSATKFFESTSLPAPELLDLLIILGGPMSVNDDEKYPWLRIEKGFIRQAIDSGKMVLGICLGAQLIANCLGEEVFPNRRKEIGWFPIEGIEQTGNVFNFSSNLTVFHWHGETFDLPQGAIHLARSEGCENQAFQVGSSVLGLQFHLETTPDSAAGLVENCREEISPSKFVQPEEAILDYGPKGYRSINKEMSRVLNYLAKKQARA